MSTPPLPSVEQAFTTHTLGVPINALTWSLEEPYTLAAATGSGAIVLTRPGMSQPLTVQATTAEHALLSMVATPSGFASGDETGQLHLTTSGGESTPLLQLPQPFAEHLTFNPHSEQLAIATGNTLTCLHLPSAEIAARHVLPSSIGGLATSPIGRRVAASHYGGATIVDLAAPRNQPRQLHWQGSHLAITYAPTGKWLITAMQEQSIHLWRLSDGTNLHMRGYTGPITQFSFSHCGTWLATTGGSGVPLWNFAQAEKGPAGQRARVVAESGNAELLVTAVAMHPKGPFMAIGYADGLALLANTQTEQSILLLAPPEETCAIEHLAWSPNGIALALTTSNGTLTLADFSHLA